MTLSHPCYSVCNLYTTVYFPIMTCLVLSAAFSLVLWIVSMFRR